eukprot:1072858-Pelagomonas_calceolata.AAC.1
MAKNCDDMIDRARFAEACMTAPQHMSLSECAQAHARHLCTWPQLIAAYSPFGSGRRWPAFWELYQHYGKVTKNSLEERDGIGHIAECSASSLPSAVAAAAGATWQE